jgi:hypothetical protein
MKRLIIVAIPIMLMAAASLAEVSGEHPIASLAYGRPPGYRVNAASQIVGERPVSTPAYQPATGFPVAIASDGDGFLAVWADRRDTPSVFASRIDRDGTVLDPLGIYIATSPYVGGVAWDGDAYVVVWGDPNGTVTAERIASDGTIVTPPRLIAQRQDQFLLITVASNGKVSVVTTSNGYVVLDRDLQVIQFFSDSYAYREVFLTGRDEFTILAGNGELIAQRLDSSGHLVSSKTLGTAGGDYFNRAISCHESNCIEVSSNPATGHLQVGSYDPTAQADLSQVDLPILNATCTLVATADGFLLITADYTMQHFDLHGVPSGPHGLPCCQPINGIAAGIAATSNGSDVAVLGGDTDSTVRVTMASWTNAEKRNVTTSATAQRRPAIADNGVNYLVAWWEANGIHEGRLSGDGVPLDGTGRLIQALRLPQHPSYSYPADPFPFTTIAFDGTSYLLSASTGYDPTSATPRDGEILTARIDPATGDILARRTTCGSDMRIANNGSSTVAAWVDCTGGLELALLDANGEPASMPVTVATSGVVYVAKPSLAWNGTEWLVTWEEETVFPGIIGPVYANYFTTTAIRGARFSGALTPLDTLAIPIATGLFDLNTSSRVASDGHDFLIAWSADYVLTQAWRISASGAVSEKRVLLLGTPQVQDLIWDGVSYALAYATIDRVQHIPADLSLLRLSSSGTVLDSLAISITPDDERRAALISPGNGRLLAAYTRVAHEPLYGGVERVFVTTPRPAKRRAVRETP